MFPPLLSGLRLMDQLRAGLPRVHLAMAGADLVLRAEVPGLDPASIQVRPGTHHISFQGQRWEESTVEGQGMRSRYRSVRFVAQTVPLPGAIDPGRVTWTYRNGVLQVRAPRVG